MCFRFAQAIWRNIQKLGLAVAYRKDEDLRKKVNHLLRWRSFLKGKLALNLSTQQLRMSSCSHLSIISKKRELENMYVDFYVKIQISYELYEISSAMR